MWKNCGSFFGMYGGYWLWVSGTAMNLSFSISYIKKNIYSCIFLVTSFYFSTLMTFSFHCVLCDEFFADLVCCLLMTWNHDPLVVLICDT
jgi:hypothetical protein